MVGREEVEWGGGGVGYALLEAREGVDEALEGGAHFFGARGHGEAPAPGDGHQVTGVLCQQEQVVQTCPKQKWQQDGGLQSAFDFWSISKE
jgi:hypothetical protein